MKSAASGTKVATLAVAIALVTVFTMVVRIPLGTGYLNLCDVAIAFVAFTLGPVTALVAGGLGPCIADLAGGFGQWAVISFIVHGLEGLLMALILRFVPQKGLAKLLAGALCILIVPLGYYVLSGVFLVGFEAALADVPGNFIQSGFALSEAVVRAFPPVRHFGW